MNHKCSVDGCRQNHPYGKHVANEYQPKTHTVTYELRGIPGFIVASLFVTLITVVFCLIGATVLVGIPLFLALWGVVALIDAGLKKVRSYRRAKAPTWRDRDNSNRFIRR